MKITNKAIRAHILSNANHEAVTIKRDGQIIVRTNQPRGDGGPVPWDMFWGDRADAVEQIKAAVK